MTITAAEVSARAEVIRSRIAAAGGDPAAITIVAVTKTFGPDAVEAAVEAGLADVGENYGQELIEKASAAPAGVRWHFLGAVQTNKVAKLAPHVAVWQGVDRLHAGDAIAKRSPGATVLVQVNVSGEEQRNGCTWADAPGLVAALRDLDLDVAGLMAVATAGDARKARAEFDALAQLKDDLALRELSIGMTDDLELAVAAGSTMVRIGRALFGPREVRPR